MWRSLSIKRQLLLVSLIPITGLIYMTVSNMHFYYINYESVDRSLEKVNNIAKLSKGISEISVERGYLTYSTYDSSKVNSFGTEKQKTLEWFSDVQINDPVVAKNLKALQLEMQDFQNIMQQEQLEKVYEKYTSINNRLKYLIEREIVNCESPELAQLANNYYNYITLKEAALLKRGVVLQKLLSYEKHFLLDNAALGLYFKANNYEEQVTFKLGNSRMSGLNRDLTAFRKSAAVQSFYKNGKAIMDDNHEMDINAWWKNSTEIVNKYTELEEANLAAILDYANKEKQTALQSIIILGCILFVFLLLVSIAVYNLIHNLSVALKAIASSIKKLSQGEVIEKQRFLGNAEFRLISYSFNGLLTSIKEQIDLSLKISSGKYGSSIRVRSENDPLNQSLNTMSAALERLREASQATSLMERNIIEINKSIVGSDDLNTFGANICHTLVQQTKGCQANFFILDITENSQQLNRIGGYAAGDNTPMTIAPGQGLIGESVRANKQICQNDLPDSYSYISSSLGTSPYYNVLITPITYKNLVIGVIEIGSLGNFTDSHRKLLGAVSNTIGSAAEVLMRNEELKLSVDEIHRKNSALQAQEEELRQSNEELNRQTLLLQQSEEELRSQASELGLTNAYLEDKQRELELKNQEVSIKNDELLLAQEELELRAAEIEQSSQYKSDFLANMSHELRTPLNSILILSNLMKENTTENLSENQIENLSVINASGKDLLNLINDILDISKIEAGKEELYLEKADVKTICDDMKRKFHVQMEKKQIELTTIIAGDCPKDLYTDIGKLEQIVKNFLSNAVKFTPENGKVSLRFASGKGKEDFQSPSLMLLEPDQILSVHIEDNGIGISEENKGKLFQSFQQADSSISRKYGGTGLGLFISKELAILLGGEVAFESQLGEGSSFSVYLPAVLKAHDIKLNGNHMATYGKKHAEPEALPQAVAVVQEAAAQESDDDRDEITERDKTILIIEDDAPFAEVLLQLAREKGLKAIIASDGETGFQFAQTYKPKAIILDMKLPGVDGWTVLKWLKEDSELQHIPVHVMTGMNREKLVKEMGAFDFMVKPMTADNLRKAFGAIETQINKVFKKVMILEDDENLSHSIRELVRYCDNNIICIQAYTFKEAENILKNEEIDCAIMDIGLEDSDDIKSIAQLKQVSKNQEICVIVNTGQELTEADELALQDIADGVVIKTENASNRLKDELLLFLDKVKSIEVNGSKNGQNVLKGDILKEKKILLVDDDIRNIYALSSALTLKGASIFTAFNGIEALNVLDSQPVDIILMDIMMPEMDGFEATRKIRENEQWKDIPIIALTAKAMKGDREEMLQAGASDYQSKPIDIQKLISLISIWIYN